MNMEELHFEIERWFLIFWPCFAVSAFATLPPPEHRLRCVDVECVGLSSSALAPLLLLHPASRQVETPPA